MHLSRWGTAPKAGAPCLLTTLILSALSSVHSTDTAVKGGSLQGPGTSLDVVFLLERSSKHVMGAAPNVVKIMDNIEQDYPNSKFGISYFADFGCSDWHEEQECKEKVAKEEAHADPEGCYTHMQSLTPSKDLVHAAVKSTKPLLAFGPKSAIAALMMTATNMKTGWSKEGGRRKKIIILITESETSCCEKARGSKTPPKGDGTDTCAAMQNPTPEFMSEKLKAQDIAVYLLVAKEGQDAHAFTSWKKMASRMNIAMYMGNMVLKSNDKLYEKFRKFVKKIEERTFAPKKLSRSVRSAPKGRSMKGSAKGRSLKGPAAKGRSLKAPAAKGRSLKAPAAKGRSLKGPAAKGRSLKGRSLKGRSMKGRSMKGRSLGDDEGTEALIRSAGDQDVDAANEDEPEGKLAVEDEPEGKLAVEDEPEGKLAVEDEPKGELADEDYPKGTLAVEDDPNDELEVMREHPNKDVAAGKGDPTLGLVAEEEEIYNDEGGEDSKEDEGDEEFGNYNGDSTSEEEEEETGRTPLRVKVDVDGGGLLPVDTSCVDGNEAACANQKLTITLQDGSVAIPEVKIIPKSEDGDELSAEQRVVQQSGSTIKGRSMKGRSMKGRTMAVQTKKG